MIIGFNKHSPELKIVSGPDAAKGYVSERSWCFLFCLFIVVLACHWLVLDDSINYKELHFPHSLSSALAINLSGNAKNRTQDSRVGIVNATSVLCHPPSCFVFVTDGKRRNFQRLSLDRQTRKG